MWHSKRKKKNLAYGNNPYSKLLTKKEPSRTLRFTSTTLPYNKKVYTITNQEAWSPVYVQCGLCFCRTLCLPSLKLSGMRGNWSLSELMVIQTFLLSQKSYLSWTLYTCSWFLVNDFVACFLNSDEEDTCYAKLLLASPDEVLKQVIDHVIQSWKLHYCVWV